MTHSKINNTGNVQNLPEFLEFLLFLPIFVLSRLLLKYFEVMYSVDINLLSLIHSMLNASTKTKLKEENMNVSLAVHLQ